MILLQLNLRRRGGMKNRERLNRCLLQSKLVYLNSLYDTATNIIVVFIDVIEVGDPWQCNRMMIITKSQQRETRSLPKFGEWDVNNPASADGFTVIFSKARDEKTGVVFGGNLNNAQLQTTAKNVKIKNSTMK